MSDYSYKHPSNVQLNKGHKHTDDFITIDKKGKTFNNHLKYTKQLELPREELTKLNDEMDILNKNYLL